MGAEPNNIAKLLAEINSTARTRVDAIEESLAEQKESVNDLYKRLGRPGAEYSADDRDLEQKSAIEMCCDRYGWQHQRNEGRGFIEFHPSADEIAEAITAQKAWRAMLRHGDIQRLDPLEQKSLSSFAFSNAGWVVPPFVSRSILSCLTDPADFLSVFGQEQIASASVQIPIDNSELEGAAWACETACDGPAATIPPPGMLEVKPEPLRARVCATSDLIADSSFNIEQWILRKTERAMRLKIAAAVICGDGNGRPLGILNPCSGIPVCATSPNTPADQFTWQDLVQLKYQVDEQWAARGTFLMNRRTLSLVLTMTDAVGRPIWTMMPGGDAEGGFTIAGSPVRIVPMMPDVQAGATPIAFGDWSQAYMIVRRSPISFQTDPYSLGWCIQYKIETRISGTTVCPSAARLLRIN